MSAAPNGFCINREILLNPLMISVFIMLYIVESELCDMHLYLIFSYNIQTVNPIGCQCPEHYTLNSHFRCVPPSHWSSSAHVNPTGCTCPVNYQLNQHNRCESIIPICSDCYGVSEIRSDPGCICP